MRGRRGPATLPLPPHEQGTGKKTRNKKDRSQRRNNPEIKSKTQIPIDKEDKRGGGHLMGSNGRGGETNTRKNREKLRGTEIEKTLTSSGGKSREEKNS